MVKLSCLIGKSSTFVGIDILHKQQTTDLSHLYHIAMYKKFRRATILNPSILDFGISWFHPKKNRHRGLSSRSCLWLHEWNRRHGVDVIVWHNKSGQKIMDVILLYGYGSIPIDTFLVGWTSIYQLFWGFTRYQGFDPSPYIYIFIIIWML